MPLSAQVQVQTYAEFGEHKASEHAYLYNAYLANYQFQDFQFEGGLQLKLYGNLPHTFTAFTLSASRGFAISQVPFELKTYYVNTPYSDYLHLKDFGLCATSQHFSHFDLLVGWNLKTYKVTKTGQEALNINSSDSKLRENFNLSYRITAFLKPHCHHWNTGISITNIDHFTISQATNPILNLKTHYQINNQLKGILELWYKQAGVMNIQANYYGYFIRGGIVWDI